MVVGTEGLIFAALASAWRAVTASSLWGRGEWIAGRMLQPYAPQFRPAHPPVSPGDLAWWLTRIARTMAWVLPATTYAAIIETVFGLAPGWWVLVLGFSMLAGLGIAVLTTLVGTVRPGYSIGAIAAFGVAEAVQGLYLSGDFFPAPWAQAVIGLTTGACGMTLVFIGATGRNPSHRDAI